MENNDMMQKPVGIRILRGLLIGFGLLLMNLIFILGPYVALWSVVIAMVASGFAVTVSGFALIAAYLFSLPFSITMTLPLMVVEYPILMLLSGGLFIGIGSLLAFLFTWLAKYLVIGTGKYVMWHVRIIRGDDYE